MAALRAAGLVNSTWNNAVSLINANSDFRFTGSAVAHFMDMKEYDSAASYTAFKAAVASGKFDIVGGQIVEPDTNIPSGESLVRQSLYGQEFFTKRI